MIIAKEIVVVKAGFQTVGMIHHETFGPFRSYQEAERCVVALSARDDCIGAEILLTVDKYRKQNGQLNENQ